MVVVGGHRKSERIEEMLNVDIPLLEEGNSLREFNSFTPSMTAGIFAAAGRTDAHIERLYRHQRRSPGQPAAATVGRRVPKSPCRVWRRCDSRSLRRRPH